MGQLRVKKLRSAGRVTIDGEPITIGRSSQNTITLRSTEVSRRHCVVEATDGVTQIFDLDSQTGIKVNGERVTEAVLHDGDRIRIGRFELTFVDPDEAARAQIEAEADQREAEATGREADAARREADAARREADAARREAQAARDATAAVQREAAKEREELRQRLTEALEKAESLEAELARQVKMLQSSQHEAEQRCAATDRVIRQFATHRHQVLEAWQELAAVHRTLAAFEALWAETEEQMQDAESAAPQELQELLDRRDAIAERLDAVHAARDAAMGNLQLALEALAGVEAAAPSMQPSEKADRRRRKPFGFLRSAGVVLLAVALS